MENTIKKMMVKQQKHPEGYYTVAEVADILRVRTRIVYTCLQVDGIQYQNFEKYVLIAKKICPD